MEQKIEMERHNQPIQPIATLRLISSFGKINMNIKTHIVRQAAKEYSPRARLVVIAVASIVFVLAIPASLFWISFRHGEMWRYEVSLAISIVSPMLVAMGLSLAIWTVMVQYKRARGTPAPFAATKKLLIQKPFSYCRNPMALGTFIYYLGIAAVTGSYIALFAVFIFITGLVTMIKLIEEKEMESRFGEEYLLYKQHTPFIIPNISKIWRCH